MPSTSLTYLNGLQHSSLAAASLCTSKVVRAYFQDGTLPAPDTVCEDEEDMYFAKLVLADEEPASHETVGLAGLLADHSPVR